MKLMASAMRLYRLGPIRDWARIPPDVATVHFQYPSFRHSTRPRDIKWNSFQNSRLIIIIGQ